MVVQDKFFMTGWLDRQRLVLMGRRGIVQFFIVMPPKLRSALKLHFGAVEAWSGDLIVIPSKNPLELLRQAIVKEHGCEFDKYMQWLKTIHQDDSWTVGGNRGHYLQIDLVSTENENQVQVDWGIIGSGKVGNNQSAFWWRFIRENHVLKNDFTFSFSLEDLIYFLTYRPNNSHSSDFVNFAFGMSEGGWDWKHGREALEFSLWSERSLYSYHHKVAEDCFRFFDRLSPHLCFLTKDYFWKFSVLRVLMLRSVATGVGMRISRHMTLGGIVDTIDFDDAQRYW